MSQAGEAFGISTFTINKWKRLLERTGSLEDAPRSRNFKKLDPEKLKALRGRAPRRLPEGNRRCVRLFWHGRVQGPEAAEDHAQKKTGRFREQKPEQVGEYLAELEKISGRPIVYVDETGTGTCLCREHGRSPRGKPVMGEVSGRKFKRVGVVAGQAGKSIVAPMQYGGTMGSEVFESWFEAWLLPSLPDGSVIVMDNASFHRKGRLHALAERAGHRVLFLPPYSPELNPIEHFWAWLKGRLRKTLPLFSSFDEALHEAFQVN